MPNTPAQDTSSPLGTSQRLRPPNPSFELTSFPLALLPHILTRDFLKPTQCMYPEVSPTVPLLQRHRELSSELPRPED